ncbi:MAG: phytochelatin synthase family protein [Pseudomonadota bacterium]
MKRVLKVLAAILLITPVLLAGFVWYTLQPKEQNLTLPTSLVSADSAQGVALLESSNYKADFMALDQSFVAQRYISFCGVASSVTVLNALGRDSNQSAFFTDATRDVRSQFEVTFGGMTLEQLDGLLSAHGLKTQAVHGDELSLEEFRAIVERNLSTDDDYLLVNYQRKDLDQIGSGHISPIAAYNASSDQVLVLDTASHKYPYTWIPLELLYNALHDIDSASEKPRGIIEVAL